MDALTHNPSRRAVLGAAVGASLSSSSVTGATPTLTSPIEGEGLRQWRSALAAYRAAEAEVRGFERATAGACFAEAAAVEDEYEALGDALYDALRRLLMTPAADAASLAVKVELVVEHEVGTLEGGEACMAALVRDARSIAGLL
jgi:hypothetical protein